MWLNRMSWCPRRATTGFTLIELLIAVAIVGIIAGIAYPSYQDQIRKSRRAQGKTELLELAQFMERNFTITGRYNLDASGAAVNTAALPFSESPKDGAGTKYYDLTLAATASFNFAFMLRVHDLTSSQAGLLIGAMTMIAGGGVAPRRDERRQRAVDLPAPAAGR